MTSLRDNAAEYLDAIEADGLVRERAYLSITFYETLYGEDEFEHVFIADLLDGGTGQRTWQSLWLWGSGNIIAECRNFLFLDNRDSVVMPTIAYWQLETKNLANLSANPESVVSLNYSQGTGSLLGGYSGNMTASGHNAEHLLSFFRAWVVPRITAASDAWPQVPHKAIEL